MPNVQHILSGFIKGRIIKSNELIFVFKFSGERVFEFLFVIQSFPALSCFRPLPPLAISHVELTRVSDSNK